MKQSYMDNSLKILYDEHNIISRAIEIAQKAKALINIDNDEYSSVIQELIRFFRIYADQYHHYKEEVILFPEMIKKSELIADGIIHEMLDNHANFRDLLKSIESELSQNNYEEVSTLITTYTEALLDHIAVENEEVFQTAYMIFNEIELENIYYRFEDHDREMGETKKKDFADLTRILDDQSQLFRQ
jgi:hemerythrin-like domain-containing protein